MGALTSKIYSFKYRSWEFKSYFHFDIFDIFAFPIRVDFLNSSIIRILPRYNNKKKSLDWISDKARFSYDAFEKQRVLSAYMLTITNQGFKSHFPVHLKLAIKSLKNDLFTDFSINIDLLVGNFFDIITLSFFKRFLSFIGSYRVFFSSLTNNFFYDFRLFFYII